MYIIIRVCVWITIWSFTTSTKISKVQLSIHTTCENSPPKMTAKKTPHYSPSLKRYDPKWSIGIPTKSWTIITGLFSNGSSEKNHRRWPFRNLFGIPMTISRLIFSETDWIWKHLENFIQVSNLQKQDLQKLLNTACEKTNKNTFFLQVLSSFTLRGDSICKNPPKKKKQLTIQYMQYLMTMKKTFWEHI